MKFFLSCALLLFLLTGAESRADSLDLKIGQMLMVGMSGTSVSPQSPILDDIRQGKVGGILLFEYNIAPGNSREKLLALTNALQDASTVPLFIAIDQEGGKVNRLKTKYGFLPVPSARAVADSNDFEYAARVAADLTGELQTCGINLNFAPVADLHDAICPVLGKLGRCFSPDPNLVTTYDSLYIEKHRERGILPVMKHFPGHGSSRSDSHLGLVDVSRTWREEELIPYRRLIGEGMVSMVMSAHIINRQLDSSGMPATLSPRIINGLLRDSLGFGGVIVSDDMQMHAISSRYSLEESLKRGIEAGIDLFIFSNNIRGASKYAPSNLHAAIRRLVKRGEISEKRIDESYRRLLALKQRR